MLNNHKRIIDSCIELFDTLLAQPLLIFLLEVVVDLGAPRGWVSV